jgi:hypothetical protein
MFNLIYLITKLLIRPRLYIISRWPSKFVVLTIRGLKIANNMRNCFKASALFKGLFLTAASCPKRDFYTHSSSILEHRENCINSNIVLGVRTMYSLLFTFNGLDLYVLLNTLNSQPVSPDSSIVLPNNQAFASRTFGNCL